jgi:hypothetical protein
MVGEVLFYDNIAADTDFGWYVVNYNIVFCLSLLLATSYRQIAKECRTLLGSAASSRNHRYRFWTWC